LKKYGRESIHDTLFQTKYKTNLMPRKLYFFLIIINVFLGCKKRNSPISWNGNYIIPISKDSINLSKIFGVDKLSNSDNGEYAVYNDTLEIFNLDQNTFLPELDFNITDTLDIPSIIYGIPFPPGFEIPISYIENVIFDLNDVKLKEIDFNNLKVKYSINSNIDGILYFILNIPNAKNSSGSAFKDTIIIPSAAGQMNNFEGEILLDNYIFDLSNNNSAFNNIVSSIRFGFSSENTQNIVFTSNDFLSINLSLIDLNINTVSGYLGNMEITDTSIISLDFMNQLSSNNIIMEDPELKLMLINGVGMDAQIIINEVLFKKNQNAVLLQHPFIGQTINISRALDLGWDFRYGSAEINFTNQNSNLNEIISFFPEAIELDYKLITNPLGNHSAFNDFYNTNHSFKINAGLKVPLKFNIDDLKLVDSLEIIFPENINPKQGIIEMKINNELPIECCLSMKLLNGDSISIYPKCISSAIVDIYGNFIESNTNEFEIVLDENTMEYLTNKKNIILEIILSSPNSTNNFPIKNNQYFSYEINLELNTEINID